jgi:hypothetical protein
MHRTLTLIFSLSALGGFFCAVAQSRNSFDGFKLVDKAGNIRKPDDYREMYQMLRAYTVLDPKGGIDHASDTDTVAWRFGSSQDHDFV